MNGQAAGATGAGARSRKAGRGASEPWKGRRKEGSTGRPGERALLPGQGAGKEKRCSGYLCLRVAGANERRPASPPFPPTPGRPSSLVSCNGTPPEPLRPSRATQTQAPGPARPPFAGQIFPSGSPKFPA